METDHKKEAVSDLNDLNRIILEQVDELIENQSRDFSESRVQTGILDSVGKACLRMAHIIQIRESIKDSEQNADSVEMFQALSFLMGELKNPERKS